MNCEGLTVLGWREWISLPDLGIIQIKAKVDTGARTSCLHSYNIDVCSKGGQEWVRFKIHPAQENERSQLICEAPIKDYRKVTDSGGHSEMRYVIETNLVVGNIRKPIEITLTNRDNMKFRMLLGRTAMEGDIIVNPFESYLTNPKPN